MRLINTKTLQLAEFVGSEIPPYAILSHRWASSSEEPSFKDFRKGLKQETSGYRKILEFCQLAASENWQWAWVDTICIDKRSSAELSESINSMYKWYKDAGVCYAYLSDVHQNGDWRTSEWWTRGWTLQELLAPDELMFHNAEWQFIGSKVSMASDIASVTRIPIAVLGWRSTSKIQKYLVAQKMSWAAGRKTTRIEDRAYSLLGLFNSQMPLLYGEGEKAFERLQLQILTKYPDDSILAWDPKDDTEELPTKQRLVLASSPDLFARCGHDGRSSHEYSRPGQGDIASRITSRGIEWWPRANRHHHKDASTRDTSPVPTTPDPIWAVLLTAIIDGKTIALPYVLVLEWSGPLDHHYRRVQCYRSTDIGRPQTFLSQNFDFETVTGGVFYLHYDIDIQPSIHRVEQAGSIIFHRYVETYNRVRISMDRQSTAVTRDELQGRPFHPVR